MKILSIELTNWQSYRGSGKSARRLDFSGGSGESNCIVYGQNTHGKTALWQAIRFALYGRVNKRMAGWREGKFKPIVATDSADEPLLNITAHENGDYTVGVRLGFEHNGERYMLDRSYTSKKGVKIPRRSSQMEQTFMIRNEDNGTYVEEKQQFVNDILPENLARFFMFDGERLDEYRDLFEDTSDVELKNFIEAILRFPVLTDGITDFEKIEKTLKKEISKFAVKHRKGEAAAEELDEANSDLDVRQEVAKDHKEEREGYEERLDIVVEWLKENDEGKKALAQQEMFQAQQDEAVEQIKNTERSMAKALPGSWKAIISTKIDSRLGKVQGDLERQKKDGEKIGALDVQISHLNNKLEGKPCSTCKTPLKVPSSKEQDSILKKIVSLESNRRKLVESRIDPSPAYLHNRSIALSNLKSDMKLDRLLELEKQLLSWRSKKRKAKQDLDKASKMLTNEVRKEVAKFLLEQGELLKKIGKVLGREEENNAKIYHLETEIEKLGDILGTGGGKKKPAYRKAEIKRDLVVDLKNEWELVTDEHREGQRRSVEAAASKVFMSLSNKSKTYKGLKIYEDFQMAILDKKGRRDAGSGGQWGLLAYSVLDALTTCSGIDFPLVIDTPGRSIDDEHLLRLYDYLFNCGKQVLLFPEGSELKPEIGDKRYGHTCAATYELKLNEKDQRITDIKRRINNLGK